MQVASLDELSQELEDLTALKAQILMMLGVDQELEEETISLAESNRDSVTTRLALMGVDHMKAAANLSEYAPRDSGRWRDTSPASSSRRGPDRGTPRPGPCGS